MAGHAPRTISARQRRDPRRALGMLAAGLAMVTGIAVVDYLTGSEVSVSLLYLIAICWCAWYAGRGASVLIAGASAAAWLGAVLLERGLTGLDWVLAWNTLMMGSIFVIVAVLVATLKTTQANLEAAHADLEATVVERTAELHGTVTALEAEIAQRMKQSRTNALLVQAAADDTNFV